MRTIQSILVLLIICLCVTSTSSAIEPANPNLSAEGREILDYLASIYGKKVLAGYNVYVHTPDDYRQTGKMAAIWGRDIRWLDDLNKIADHVKRNRYILTLHWHWFYDEDSAWTGKRKTPVDMGRMTTPGTPEFLQAIKEMDATADKLAVLRDAGIPVLWRPLHEIDGGWFWWTDKKTPENTAKLWRMMFNHFTKVRGLDNLIWVYSAGVGKKTAEERSGFYPGAEYVDISGIDIYGVDFKIADPKYQDYFDTMSKVSPGKILACGESDAIPNPDLMESGETPRWLYAMPWWGAPSGRRPVDWARMTMRQDLIVTLDELPPFGKGNISPHVGILSPADDGSAWFTDKAPKISVYAVDRDGSIDRVEFFADDRLIGTVRSAPFEFTWNDAPRGCYDITAVAYDNEGAQTRSAPIAVVVGMIDAARGATVVASPGESPEAAVDGDHYTCWSAEKLENASFTIDLGQVQTVDRVNLVWGWKIHPSDFVIDVSTDKSNFSEVYAATDRPYQAWKATDRVTFEKVKARYIRLRMMKRAGNQTWSGYKLGAFEVPVAN